MLNLNAKISLAILGRLRAGADLPTAIDAVLGAGSFQRIADETHAALRSR